MSGSLFPIILTPKDEVECYAQLRVPLDSGIYQVAIRKYRCSNPTFGKDPGHGGTQEAVRFKDRVLRAGGRGIVDQLGASAFVGVFVGKGARRDIIAVLTHVDRCGLLDSSLDKQAALQKICDDYIGLDCNGFVGNWADENCISPIGPSTPPSGMGHTFRRSKRATLQDIQPYDILVWHNHVAAVESIGPLVGGGMPHRVAVVCEAYGAIMCRERNLRPSGQAGQFMVADHTWAAAEAFGVGLGAVAPLAAAPAELALP